MVEGIVWVIGIYIFSFIVGWKICGIDYRKRKGKKLTLKYFAKVIFLGKVN